MSKTAAGPWIVAPVDADCATVQRTDRPLDNPAKLYVGCPHETAQAEADKRNRLVCKTESCSRRGELLHEVDGAFGGFLACPECENRYFFKIGRRGPNNGKNNGPRVTEEIRAAIAKAGGAA